MKFEIGDPVDAQLCVALEHEFMRCEEAFMEFFWLARQTIERQTQDRRLAYRCYNAYVRFLHHLYEFEMGAVIRERRNTNPIDGALAERYINSEIQRILTNRRTAIINSTAPAWENDLSFYPEHPPVDFANKLRIIRNKAIAHVSHERPKIDLTVFYENYHKFVWLMYYDIRAWWSSRSDPFPDLDEITAFSVVVQRDQPNSSES